MKLKGLKEDFSQFLVKIKKKNNLINISICIGP